MKIKMNIDQQEAVMYDGLLEVDGEEWVQIDVVEETEDKYGRYKQLCMSAHQTGGIL